MGNEYGAGMNLQRFNDLMKIAGDSLGQSIPEWKTFLEFADAYFKTRGILNPIVVEIGTMNNAQKPFYQELLNADHIGIDIVGRPDILGSSQSLATFDGLKKWLGGRPIDLLFIDGDHTYAAVKSDYEIYGPLTRHIIAFHDINHPFSPEIPEETMRLWKEIIAADKCNILFAIQCHNSAKTGITAGRQMGIGLIIKQGGEGM